MNRRSFIAGLMASAAAFAVLPYAARAGLINVKNFGAIGDGKANDRPAFLAADAVARKAGTAVYIPAGVYNLVGDDSSHAIFSWERRT